MKKIALLILAVFALCSCSKDETTATPADGQYIADAMDLVACVVLENGKCTYFAPFICGKAVSSWDNVSTYGDYPNYVYRVEDLTITANFESPTTFTVSLVGSLNTGNNKPNELPNGTQLYFDSAGIKFKLDNRTLDANGDGILDEMQPDLSNKQHSKFSANK